MAYADVVKSDMPLLYYRLQEASGTSAIDSSVNALHGAYINTPILGAAGPHASEAGHKSVNFRAAEAEQMKRANSTLMNVADRLSLEFWMRRTVVNTTDRQWFLSKGTSTSNATNAYVVAFQPDNKLLFRKSWNTDMAVSTLAITDTTNWYHVVITKDGAARQIIINALDSTTLGTNDTLQDTTADFLLANEPSSTTTYSVMLSEVALYNYPLPLERIQRHYYSGLMNLDFVGMANG